MAEGTDPSPRVRLSPYERLALMRIEAHLRRDRRFARRMGVRRARSRLWPALLLLAAASTVLAVVGVRTSDPVALWGFAVAWPLTLVQGARLLCRACRDHGAVVRRGPCG
ncbi:DUF3040 domain-containing protein [Streptomyces sp. NPDC051987]|uniref:DUF3040 domain-containing protein n=1 Tax=Streptomyces sp. NPDC051987 TaxID=3155808 RepID=UPI0034189902